MMFLKFTKCITTLTFLIINQYVFISSSVRLNIERGDQDVFDNPNCKNATRDGCNCNGLNAACVDSSCQRCKCSSTYKTFLSSNDTNGNGRCVKDRHLLFIPTFPNSFSVQNKMCMRTMLSGNRIRKTKCNKSDPQQRWIWTQYDQLMHVDTLKCLQESTSNRRSLSRYYYFLVLGKCTNTEKQQLWQCLGPNNDNVNFRSKEKKLYMYQYYKWDNIYGADNDYYKEHIKWERYPSNAENLCSKAFGCYEFVKYSSVILVADVRNCSQQCLQEREISVPKSRENLCFVMWEKLQYLDNDEWKQLLFKDEIFTIDKKDKATFWKLNLTKATNDWTGLIVKLNFYCGEENLTKVNTNDIKCVVIKFKGNAIYPPTVSPTIPTIQKVTTTLSTKGSKDTRTAPSTVVDTGVSKTSLTINSPTTMSNTNGAAEKYKSDSSPPVIIIVVPSVIAIFILCGILGFIFYKRRRRSVIGRRKEDDSPTDTQPSEATTNPIYSPIDNGPTPFISGNEEMYQEPQTGALQKFVHKESGTSANTQPSQDTMNPLYSPVDNKPTPFFSGNEETYQEPQTGASRECDLYESGDNPVYDSADIEQNGKRSPKGDQSYHNEANDEESYNQSLTYEMLEDPTVDK